MKTILLAEDDSFIIDIYALGLRKEGYRVDIAKDCEIALEKIKNSYPDLLILDIDFGSEKMDGCKLLKIIRSDPGIKSLKVIVISNLEQKDYPENIDNLGVIKFFLKVQNTPEEIVNAVKKILK